MSNLSLAALLPPETDGDILEYLSSTVEQAVEEGDTSVDALCEALSDLLLSYELVKDEETARELCCRLHESLAAAPVGAAAAAATASDAPPARAGRGRRKVATVAARFRTQVRKIGLLPLLPHSKALAGVNHVCC